MFTVIRNCRSYQKQLRSFTVGLKLVGKYENRNDLIFLLDEMLRQEDHGKVVDTLDIEMADGEEPPISEDINDIIKLAFFDPVATVTSCWWSKY